MSRRSIQMQAGRESAGGGKDFSKMSWNELRAFAKEKGVSTHHKDRAEIEAELAAL